MRIYHVGKESLLNGHFFCGKNRKSVYTVSGYYGREGILVMAGGILHQSMSLLVVSGISGRFE
ncbi:MAG TPA: hypothetical protein H9796_02650 [Candidatus Butyricimonas faecavium]|nr:hypothetical protein [Candidatus Butyricimonas faecavium]